MTRNNEHLQTHSNAVVTLVRRLHSHPTLILVFALIAVAGILGTHLDWPQLLANPVALIVGGIGFVVGLHLLGVGLLAFWGQRRSLEQQKSGHHHNHEGGGDQPHDDDNTPTLETKGQTIPWASFYDRIVKLASLGKEESFRKATIALAQLKPGETVLDVGCGTGSLALIAKEQVGPTGAVYGTDASAAMIEVARQKAAKAGADVTFQVDLIENITFPDNQFDVVLSSLMMHHLPDDLKRAGLAEIYRVLKPDGRLLVVDIESSSNGSLARKFSDFIIQLHGGHTAMQDNVKKLVPLMEVTGFTGLKTDRINRQFSYVMGRKVPVS